MISFILSVISLFSFLLRFWNLLSYWWFVVASFCYGLILINFAQFQRNSESNWPQIWEFKIKLLVKKFVFFLVLWHRRNHSPILNKYVNHKVCFPKFDSLTFSAISISLTCPWQIAPLSGIIQTQVICFFKHNINQIISTINICSTYVDFAANTSSNYLFAHGLPPLSPSFRRHQRPLEPARAFNPFLVVEDTGLWPLSDIPPNIWCFFLRSTHSWKARHHRRHDLLHPWCN